MGIFFKIAIVKSLLSPPGGSFLKGGSLKRERGLV